jgi:hypothetical protein
LSVKLILESSACPTKTIDPNSFQIKERETLFGYQLILDDESVKTLNFSVLVNSPIPSFSSSLCSPFPLTASYTS